MARLDSETDSGRKKSAGTECTCSPRQINHYVVAVSDCEKHENAKYFRELRERPGSSEYYAEANRIQGKMLYHRQQLMQKAEALVADVHAKAASQGRKATFQDLRRAAGLPDIQQAIRADLAGQAAKSFSYGKVPHGAFQKAYANLRNERNAERAMIDPPPDFDPNTFDAWRQAQRIDQLMSETPDDQEHAQEFAILTDLRHWLDQNRECGRKEWELTERRIRTAAMPPDEPEAMG